MFLKSIKLTIYSTLDSVSLIGITINKMLSMIPLSEIDAFQTEQCIVEACKTVVQEAYCYESGHVIEVLIKLYIDKIVFEIIDSGKTIKKNKSSLQYAENSNGNGSLQHAENSNGNGNGSLQYTENSNGNGSLQYTKNNNGLQIDPENLSPSHESGIPLSYLKIMNEVEYKNHNDKNVLTLVKYYESGKIEAKYPKNLSIL